MFPVRSNDDRLKNELKDDEDDEGDEDAIWPIWLRSAAVCVDVDLPYMRRVQVGRSDAA